MNTTLLPNPEPWGRPKRPLTPPPRGRWAIAGWFTTVGFCSIFILGWIILYTRTVHYAVFAIAMAWGLGQAARWGRRGGLKFRTAAVLGAVPFLLLLRGCGGVMVELGQHHVNFGPPMQLAGQDRDSRVNYHVIMNELFETDQFFGDEITFVDHKLNFFFVGLDGIDPYGGLFGTLREQLIAAQAVDKKVRRRRDAMDGESFSAAVERVRARYPDWVEDKRLYLAWCFREAGRSEAPRERRELATAATKQMAVNWPYANYGRRSFAIRRSPAIAQMVQEAVADMRQMSAKEKDTLLIAAIRSNPRWKGRPWQHLAAMLLMLENGDLIGELKWEATAFLEGRLGQRLPYERPAGWRMNLRARDALMEQVNLRLIEAALAERLGWVRDLRRRAPHARLYNRHDYDDRRPPIGEQLRLLDERAFYGPTVGGSLPLDIIGFSLAATLVFLLAEHPDRRRLSGSVRH